jgi:ubiquitin carboxyl-terminal hydrolase 8
MQLPPSTGDAWTMEQEEVGLEKLLGPADAIEKKTVGKAGLCGLQNIGNTCYMNSIIQCLSNITDLRNYFTGEINNTPDELTNQFGRLIKKLWNGKSTSIKPSKFKATLPSLFVGNLQHDAHELLVTVLNGLHDSLDRLKSKQDQQDLEPVNESMPDEELSEFSWENHKKQNDSLIVDLFHGQCRSQLRCPTSSCTSTSVKFDPVMFLTLPVPKGDREDSEGREACDLKTCMSMFTSEEQLDPKNKWFCPDCKQDTQAYKKLGIWKLPSVLILHLKRFHHTDRQRKKISTDVNFPVRSLDMDPFLQDNSPHKHKGNSLFDLVAVCNHQGDLDSGHYTSYAYNSKQKAWYV